MLCPHGGHIRKAYPRDEVPGAQSHRLLRRGTPFGPVDPPEAERGLLFLCYQTSIEQQFEYVLRNWVNFPDFATPGAGVDPIIGSGANSGATFSFPAADGGAATSIHTDLDWTTMTGGGYFFVPSVGALRTFGG